MRPPVMTDCRQMGSDRKRSKIPFEMSVFRATPVYIVMNATVWTRMPGMANSAYALVDPSSAFPNKNVNSSVNMIGNIVTSNSCCGTCLILSNARQPNVSDAESGPGG